MSILKELGLENLATDIINSLPISTCPERESILECFKDFKSVDEIEVLFLLQDPYPQKQNNKPLFATGRSLDVGPVTKYWSAKSVSPDEKKIPGISAPRSLQNFAKLIYQEVNSSCAKIKVEELDQLDFPKPFELIKNLAKTNKALFLNTYLTVPLGGVPKEHKKFWKDFSFELLKELFKTKENKKFKVICFGKEPFDIVKSVLKDKSHDCIISYNHPSARSRLKIVGVLGEGNSLDFLRLG